MRISENNVFLKSGEKIGTIAKSSGGHIAALILPVKGFPSAAGHGETEIAAIDDARKRIWAQIDQASICLHVLKSEMDRYEPAHIRREINETAQALSEALANVETLRDRLVRLGVKTDGARKVRDTINATREMVSNLG